jgi:hypothetical protein
LMLTKALRAGKSIRNPAGPVVIDPVGGCIMVLWE